MVKNLPKFPYADREVKGKAPEKRGLESLSLKARGTEDVGRNEKRG